MFINSMAVRALSFLLAGGLLAVSLFGLYWAFTTPAETEGQSSIPVASYQQQGRFDYTVHLRPNTLFDTTELGPGQVYFTRLVDNISITFYYRFSSGQSLEETVFNYQVNATYGSPELWEKEFVLIPPTATTQDDFSCFFNLSVPQFIALAETFRQETEASLQSPQLTVKVQVQPQAQTQYGPITEPFEQTLIFSFEGATIGVEEELEKLQSGAITDTKSEAAPGLERVEQIIIITASGIGALGSILLLSGLGWLYIQSRNRIPIAEKELRDAQKKLQGLLVQTDKLPPAREGQVVIRLNSLPDLLNLAEETFQPVVYSANESGFVYCMTDGSGTVRYEYASEKEKEKKAVRL